MTPEEVERFTAEAYRAWLGGDQHPVDGLILRVGSFDGASAHAGFEAGIRALLAAYRLRGPRTARRPAEDPSVRHRRWRRDNVERNRLLNRRSRLAARLRASGWAEGNIWHEVDRRLPLSAERGQGPPVTRSGPRSLNPRQRIAGSHNPDEGSGLPRAVPDPARSSEAFGVLQGIQA